MSTEIERVRYAPGTTDLRGIRFTQSPTGHVHSPWFTYDYSPELDGDGKLFYGGNRWQYIIEGSKHAFASILGVDGRPGRDVIVTESEEFDTKTGESFGKMWRLSTKGPAMLPKQIAPAVTKIERGNAIDV